MLTSAVELLSQFDCVNNIILGYRNTGLGGGEKSDGGGGVFYFLTKLGRCSPWFMCVWCIIGVPILPAIPIFWA